MNKDILNDLFDTNTFVQTNSYVVSPLTEGVEAGDGVITGYGSIDGRAVFAAIQDETVLKGSVGITHAQKISSCIDHAVKSGTPFIFLINTAGARINEGLEVLAGYGKIIKSLSSAIGVIPTISIVNGSCTGVASIIASMTDFTIMSEDSYFAFSGKDALSSTTINDIKNICNSKGNSKYGKVSLTATNISECFIKAKKLLDFLPDNCENLPYDTDVTDDINRKVDGSDFQTFAEYDVKDLIKQITDNGDFIEISSEYAKNAVTCFARIGNKSVCIIANQPLFNQGLLTNDACDKISSVLAFCDKFSIPVVTLTNTAGFEVSIEEEIKGVSSSAALLATSFANSEITKINIITGKAYGSSYLIMNGKNTGADIVYAWDKADISVISPEAGALLVYNDEIKNATDPKKAREEFINKYKNQFSTPMHAAYKGLVDDVISPSETRARIISALYLFG